MQTRRVIGSPGCGSFRDQRERAGFFGSFAAAAFKLIGRDNDVAFKKERQLILAAHDADVALVGLRTSQQFGIQFDFVARRFV